MKQLEGNFFHEIKQIIADARQRAYSAVNTAMVDTYWLIDEHIVMQEQQGEQRAEYGKQTLRQLSRVLKAEFGKGFDERELRRMRQFQQ